MSSDIADAAPFIVDLPYGEYDVSDFKTELESTFKDLLGEVDDPAAQERVLLSYMLDYPTVYIVHGARRSTHSRRDEYTVYVGETNDIRHRTMQHINVDSKRRDDWKSIAEALRHDGGAYRQYVISHPMFNKSLTLDVENRLMHYLSSADSVRKLNNRRTNAQGRYYTSDRFDAIFSEIWMELHREDPKLFPAEEIIHDSALFKASPFHRLSDDQTDAEEAILAQLGSVMATGSERVKTSPKLIFVQGAAGTGKTVLLSHLFYRIATELGIQDDENTYVADEDRVYPHPEQTRTMSAYLLVNQKEQVHVYDQIAVKLGLQKKAGDVVMLPSTFINRFSATKDNGRANVDVPQDMADIVLVDEAHLLATQGTQGYSGKNHLYDILRRARIVVAVFDPHQILQARQQWRPSVLRRLFPNGFDGADAGACGIMDNFDEIELGAEEGLPTMSVDVARIRLAHQFRIAASEGIVRWIDRFASGQGIDQLPVDHGEYDSDGTMVRKPYEIRVFDSPVTLFEAIRAKAQLPAGGYDGVGLSRLLATYDWKYSSKSRNDADPNGYWNVSLYRDASGFWKMGSPADYPIEDTEVFCKPWNYQLSDSGYKDTKDGRGGKDLAWAEKPYTIDEIGSTFTIQGFDLNYAGVIIGPSVKYRDGRIIFDPTASQNHLATNKRRDMGDFSEEHLRNELNVLLKRGVHGLYLFAVDEQLQRRLRECCGE